MPGPEQQPPTPLVMRARLAELEPCWLEVFCGQCTGTTQIAIGLLIRQHGDKHQLGAIVSRLKCKRCSIPPSAVWLTETHTYGPGRMGSARWWKVPIVQPKSSAEA